MRNRIRIKKSTWAGRETNEPRNEQNSDDLQIYVRQEPKSSLFFLCAAWFILRYYEETEREKYCWLDQNDECCELWKTKREREKRNIKWKASECECFSFLDSFFTIESMNHRRKLITRKILVRCGRIGGDGADEEEKWFATFVLK